MGSLIIISDTPPDAASIKTWKYCNQEWSDWINVSTCNHDAFGDSYTDPYCRSYTQDQNTWYYYNWPYVDANQELMCPTPWRVPTDEDFSTLRACSEVSGRVLAADWGIPGEVSTEGVRYVGEEASLWSSTEISGSNFATVLPYPDHWQEFYGIRILGLTVRCVR